MSAAARAEARRKAILSRGTDRLAKLTTSARGEDAPAYLHDDPPLASFSNNTRSFLGEESSNMPTPAPARASLSPSPSPQPAASSTLRASPSPAASTATSPAASKAGSRHTSGTHGRETQHNPDPSVWLPEQQAQFMQALLAASSGGGPGAFGAGAGAGGFGGGMPGLPASSPIGDPNAPADLSGLPPIDNPFAALMGPGGLGGGGGPGGAFGAGGGLFGEKGMAGMGGLQQEPPKEKTKLQKLLPLLHLLVMWALLAYFVLWAEPRMYAATTGTEPPFDFGGKGWKELGWRGLGEGLGKVWSRWAQLGRGSKGIEGVVGRFGVQVVPFFWAFTTLQIILHSIRIFSGFDAVQPPALLALALPHLPPPFPSLIINALKYAQMGGAFLDDLAGLVVGVGFVVYFSGWVGRGEGVSWVEGVGF